MSKVKNIYIFSCIKKSRHQKSLKIKSKPVVFLFVALIDTGSMSSYWDLALWVQHLAKILLKTITIVETTCLSPEQIRLELVISDNMKTFVICLQRHFMHGKIIQKEMFGQVCINTHTVILMCLILFFSLCLQLCLFPQNIYSNTLNTSYPQS